MTQCAVETSETNLGSVPTSCTLNKYDDRLVVTDTLPFLSLKFRHYPEELLPGLLFHLDGRGRQGTSIAAIAALAYMASAMVLKTDKELYEFVLRHLHDSRGWALA